MNLTIISFEQQINDFVSKVPLPTETKYLALQVIATKLKEQAEAEAREELRSLEKEKSDGTISNQEDESVR